MLRDTAGEVQKGAGYEHARVLRDLAVMAAWCVPAPLLVLLPQLDPNSVFPRNVALRPRVYIVCVGLAPAYLFVGARNVLANQSVILVTCVSHQVGEVA